MTHVFRNLEIVEIVGESPKAIKARVKFVSKVANSCHLCGRELDTEISRATGIGPVCAEKLGISRAKANDARAILDAVEALAAEVGVLGPVVIAKSQIVAHLDSMPETSEPEAAPRRRLRLEPEVPSAAQVADALLDPAKLKALGLSIDAVSNSTDLSEVTIHAGPITITIKREP